MTEAQKGALRSLGRSILFAILPIVLVASFWIDLGVKQEYALIGVAVVGAIIRAVWPDLLGGRAEAQ